MIVRITRTGIIHNAMHERGQIIDIPKDLFASEWMEEFLPLNTDVRVVKPSAGRRLLNFVKEKLK